MNSFLSTNGINDLILKRPASAFCHRWRDGTPIGSGKTGIMLYGGVSAERLVINRSDLWHGGVDAPVPEVSEAITKMRELQKNGKYPEANSIAYKALIEKKYENQLADMRVLGCVNINFNNSGIYSRYRRILHLDTAEAEISYLLDEKSYNRKYFMSRKRDIAVIEINSECGLDFSLDAGFFESGEGGKEEKARLSDGKFAQYKLKEDCYVYSSQNEGKFFGIVCRVVSGGKADVTEKGISVKDSTKTLVLIKAFSCEEDRESAELKAVKALIDCPTSYIELFNENLPIYQKLYNTAEIKLYNGEEFHTNEQLLENARDSKLSCELAEKLWRFSRYLFISGTAEGALPFPLYGIWPCGYEREFTHHVANENVQSIYWHTDVGGLEELVLPLIDYYYSKMDGFRENARKIYNCRGIFVGTYTTPVNSTVSWYVPVILHFCGVAGWLSSHFYRYYLYSGDEKTLNEKILPFMIEAAEFYEDYHYIDESGKLALYPAVSPENSPIEYEDKTTAHAMTSTKNPTIEIAVLKELLNNLLEIAKTHHIPGGKTKIWQKMLSILPEYYINEDGAVAEWIDENLHDTYSHRHLSHLYPVFPGTEIEDSGKPELIPAFERAVDLREFGSFCGWSLPHMSAIYSRLHSAEKAFDTLNMLSKVCLLENFLTLGYDYRDMGITGNDCGNEFRASVQLDAIMGAANALQEMFVFSTPKILRLLPACPAEFGKGEADLRFVTGKIIMYWDNQSKECHGTITALRKTDIKLELPFGKEPIILKLEAGEKFEF